MSEMIPFIAAAGERPGGATNPEYSRRGRSKGTVPIDNLPAHRHPGKDAADFLPAEARDTDVSQHRRDVGHASEERSRAADEYEKDRQRRIYRGRTAAMLRRYMRYSIETGRLPSLLGREFFRSKVTSYTVVTFEGRVIFVHDMEKCLNRLDEFSQQVLGRIVLQEYEHEDAARLLGCTRMTVHRRLLLALDLLGGILLEVGLLDPLVSCGEKSCQGGKLEELLLSDCDDDK